MYRRNGHQEDPWVSVKDHQDPSGNLMVYGGNSKNEHNTVLQTTGGMRVYIRSDKDTTVIINWIRKL